MGLRESRDDDISSQECCETQDSPFRYTTLLIRNLVQGKALLVPRVGRELGIGNCLVKRGPIFSVAFCMSPRPQTFLTLIKSDVRNLNLRKHISELP